MKNQAKSPHPTVDVRDRCKVLKICAPTIEVEQFLAHLYTTLFIDGGEVKITNKNKEEVYKF